MFRNVPAVMRFPFGAGVAGDVPQLAALYVNVCTQLVQHARAGIDMNAYKYHTVPVIWSVWGAAVPSHACTR